MSSSSSSIPEILKSRCYSVVRFAWDSANKAPGTRGNSGEGGRPPLALSVRARLLRGRVAGSCGGLFLCEESTEHPRPPRLLFPSFPDAADTDRGNEALAGKLGAISMRLVLTSLFPRLFCGHVGTLSNKQPQFETSEREVRLF